MKKFTINIVLILLTLSVNAQSIEIDKMLGEQNAQMVATEMGIYEDVDKTAYVRRVGERLVAELENPLFDYQFHLVEDPSPNAFALPGGYLYVTTGLIPILQSEDELACILGHEIIHSNNRHSIKQIKKSIFPKLLEIPGNLIGMIDPNLGDLFNAPIENSNLLLLASYGRKAETEADNQGIRLAARAGYNPNAMITALTRLSKTVEVATQQKERKSYFNDHPYTPDRSSYIKKQIKEMKWQEKKPISSNYLNEFKGSLFGESPRKGIISDNTFLHPELDFFVAFPEGWTINNQSSNISAYNQEQNSGILVALDNPSLTPKQAAHNFIDNLKPEFKEKIVAKEDYNMDNKSGYLIYFQDQVKNETVYAYALWVPLDNKLFSLMGIGTKKEQQLLKKSANSLRKLNSQEKNNFTVNKMDIVLAKEGETLESLSKRVNNILTIDLTQVINTKKPNQKLKKGEQIKVIKTYKY